MPPNNPQERKSLVVDVEMLPHDRFRATSNPGKKSEKVVELPSDAWKMYVHLLLSTQNIGLGHSIDITLGEIRNNERIRKAQVIGTKGKSASTLSPNMETVKFDFDDMYIGGVSPIFEGGGGIYMAITSANLNDLPNSLQEERGNYIRIDMGDSNTQVDCEKNNQSLFLQLNQSKISHAITQNSVRLYTRAGELGIDRAIYPNETENLRYELMPELSPKNLRILPFIAKSDNFFTRFEDAGKKAGFSMNNGQGMGGDMGWTNYPEAEAPKSQIFAQHLSNENLEKMMENAYESRLLKMARSEGPTTKDRIHQFADMLDSGAGKPVERRELLEGMFLLAGLPYGTETREHVTSLLAETEEFLKETVHECPIENEDPFQDVIDNLIVTIEEQLNNLEGVEPLQKTLSRSV